LPGGRPLVRLRARRQYPVSKRKANRPSIATSRREPIIWINQITRVLTSTNKHKHKRQQKQRQRQKYKLGHKHKHKHDHKSKCNNRH